MEFFGFLNILYKKLDFSSVTSCHWRWMLLKSKSSTVGLLMWRHGQCRTHCTRDIGSSFQFGIIAKTKANKCLHSTRATSRKRKCHARWLTAKFPISCGKSDHLVERYGCDLPGRAARFPKPSFGYRWSSQNVLRPLVYQLWQVSSPFSSHQLADSWPMMLNYYSPTTPSSTIEGHQVGRTQRVYSISYSHKRTNWNGGLWGVNQQQYDWAFTIKSVPRLLARLVEMLNSQLALLSLDSFVFIILD